MDKNLGKKFNELVRKLPNNIAIQFSKDEYYSYNDLDLISEKFCVFLKKNNIKNKDSIVIESKKKIEVYALIISCLKLGISYTFVDTNEPYLRLLKIIKKVRPKKILIFERALKIKKCLLLSKKKISAINSIKIIKKQISSNQSNIAYIMFTSGSTGEPKGVQITHLNLNYFINWARKKFKINQKTKMTNINPLHFDNSIFDFYCCIFNGGTLLPIQKYEIFNLKKLLIKLSNLNCDIWFSVPSLLNMLLKLNKIKIFKASSIKKFIFGGEPFPVNSIKKIYKYISKAKIYNVSGPTECTCMCSAHLVKKKELFKNKNILVGKINSYFKYKITKNSSNKNLGELYLEGPAVSQGYINDKEKTKEKFYRIGLYNGYKTGDLVEKNNKGYLRIVGRVDNQIKILGHRVELEEIESTINKLFNLNQSLVILKKEKSFPFKKLIFITDNRKISSKIYFLKLEKELPRYMIPDEIIKIKNFIFNSNGKIDRKYYEKKFF